MTSKNVSPTRTGRRLATLALGSFAALWSATASAQTVGINPLADDYDSFGDQIAEALSGATRMDVRTPSQMNTAFGRQGCDVDRLEREIGCMLGVTLQNRIDAVVVGEVVGGAIPELVMLRVLDGGTGDNLGQVVVSVERGEIGSFDMDLAVRELSELVEGTGGGRARTPRDVTHPVVRVGLVGRLSQRSYEQIVDQGTTEFSAAPYPGLSVSLELFPLAPFIASPYAAGFGLYFEQGRHKLVTAPAAVEGTEPVEIPTRHNFVSMGAMLEVPVADGIRVVPYAGTREVEYAVAYNPQLASNSYSSLDLGLSVEYDVMEGLVAYGGGGFRPGVEGEPVTAPREAPAEGEEATYEAPANGSGFAIRFGARYSLPYNFFAGAELELENYSVGYDREGGGLYGEAADSFQMVAFTLGYAY